MANLTDQLKEREIERLRSEAVRTRERFTVLCSLLSQVLLQPAGQPFLREAARCTARLTNARYAAVLMTDSAGNVCDFAYHGLSQVEANAIGASPHGLGILGWIREQRRAVRLHDLTLHPRAVGFPEQHPGMTTFLGAPLSDGHEVVGALIATESSNGAGFEEEDEVLLEIFAGEVARAVAIRRPQQSTSLSLNTAGNPERLPTDLLGLISHELRSPLALIKTAVDWMRLEAESGETLDASAETLDTIERQADRVLGMVGNLLDMTQIETGTFSVSASPSDLGDLLAEVQETLPHHAGSGLLPEIPRVLPKVNMDRRRVRQVLETLAHIATAHAHSDKPVRVRVEPGQQQVIVSIHTLGPSIPPEELAHLFSSAPAAGGSAGGLSDRARGIGGGLGGGLALAICKSIVEAHGGRIWANSSVELGETTFAFTLPVAAAVNEPQAGVTKRSNHVGKVGRPGERARVMAIDDEPQILRYLQRTLSNAGYRPIVTDDPSTAAELVEAEDPDLVILDLVFPGGDGLKALKEIRNVSGVPVLFLSAVDGDAIVQALQAGADDYITKPFSPSELLARVEAALRRRVLPDQVEVRPTYRMEGLTVDFKDRRVTLHGSPVGLSATEYKLLFQLAANAGRILTNQELLQRVWGPEYSGEFHLLRSFIRNLRKKLEDDARSPRLIFTERGIGYRIREG